MGARSITAVIGVLAVVGLLTYGLLAKGGGGVDIGSPAPSEPLSVLGTDRPTQLADLRGEWVLLNVWASWCGPCKDESPALQSFAERNRDRLTVVGIDSRDLSTDAMDFVRRYGLTYPQWHDGDGSYAEDLGARGFPESFLVDPAGTLVAHYPGPFRDEADITGFAAPALKTGAAG